MKGRYWRYSECSQKWSKFWFKFLAADFDNSVVEENWSFEYEGWTKIAGKGLTG